MNILERTSKKYLTSAKLGGRILGALLQWRPRYFWVFLIVVIPLTVIISQVVSPGRWDNCLYFAGLNLAVWLVVKVCRKLVDIFSLRKEDSGITWCYVIILLSIGLWIVCFLLIFNVKDNGKVAAAVGAISAIVSLIFQDKIKGVVAFLHLRMHHLLSIGDWIQVPSSNVDGEVKRVTLTSVTINNWDTTTSVIPISKLHSDHFKNLQSMMEGKTHGRRMFTSFIIDSGSFHPVTEEEKIQFEGKKEINRYLSHDEISNGENNAQLFRLYLYHWLMNPPHVSQLPRLIVRWMEQVEGGMPLQVYAFIIDSSLPSFEWQQSLIIEHIFTSLEWFGLRLYQRPSGYDIQSMKGGEQ